MLRYKNMVLAFSFQIIWALIWIVLIFLYGYIGMLFMVVGGLRPLVLKMEQRPEGENPWFEYYGIAKYAAIITCCLIILFYFVNILFLPQEFLILNRYKILGAIVPAYILVHGIIGFYYLVRNKRTAL